MQFKRILPGTGTLCAGALLAASALAQPSTPMIQVSTPFNTLNDTFFERMGVNFGFSLAGGQGQGSRTVGLLPNGQINPGGNIIFSQNSISSAIPQFGNFDPNSQASLGFATSDGNGNGFTLGLLMGKGNERSNVTTTPSVIMQNGQNASIFSGQNRPFVTGVTPIIGNSTGVGIIRESLWSKYARLVQSEGVEGIYAESPGDNTASESRYTTATSTAQSGDLSVSEIKRLREQRLAEESSEQRGQIDRWVTSADQLVAAKSFGAARVHYRRAIRLIGDTPELQDLANSINEKLKQIRDRR